MKARKLDEMIRAKEKIERGAIAPTGVWEVTSGGKCGFTRRGIDPHAFQRAPKAVQVQIVKDAKGKK